MAKIGGKHINHFLREVLFNIKEEIIIKIDSIILKTINNCLIVGSCDIRKKCAKSYL